MVAKTANKTTAPTPSSEYTWIAQLRCSVFIYLRACLLSCLSIASWQTSLLVTPWENTPKIQVFKNFAFMTLEGSRFNSYLQKCWFILFPLRELEWLETVSIALLQESVCRWAVFPLGMLRVSLENTELMKQSSFMSHHGKSVPSTIPCVTLTTWRAEPNYSVLFPNCN